MGNGMGRSIALNRLISYDEDPERLLRLVAEELDSFNDINVATALSRFGKLCGSSLFPHNIAADRRFRGLMLLARDMCADGRLQARHVSNVLHSVATMNLSTEDADVQDTLARRWRSGRCSWRRICNPRVLQTPSGRTARQTILTRARW
jgi:hypothetical protein